MTMQQSETEVVVVNPLQPELPIIERAAALLRRGEVVVFPTETVYGLGADAFQVAALEKIFLAKGRPYTDPLIVHIAETANLAQLTSTFSVQAQQLAGAFWPGPLTLILPKSSQVPDMVTAGLPTVAIRMPRHAVALALIRAVGSPIAAPSANRFMHVSPTTAQHAYADLAGRVPLILDGGPTMVGVESTVLDLCAEIPTVLRPGGISLEDLRRILPNIQLAVRRPKNAEDSTGAQRSPGQMDMHYAPAIPLLLFDGTVERMRQLMLAEIERRQASGECVGVLVADEDRAIFEPTGVLIQTLGAGNAPESIAASLFAGLRALEAAQVRVILCRSFEEKGLGLAIRDRLWRAAGGKVQE